MSYMLLTVISNSTKRPETIIFNVWRDFGRTGVMSEIYRIFIYVLDDNIASVVLFQNLGNLKTNTTKILVLVLQKLSMLDSSFLDSFFLNSDNLFNSMIFNVLYLKSSTQWHILLFIVSFVLPKSIQKCRFHKIDMDFEIVASTLNCNGFMK